MCLHGARLQNRAEPFPAGEVREKQCLISAEILELAFLVSSLSPLGAGHALFSLLFRSRKTPSLLVCSQGAQELALASVGFGLASAITAEAGCTPIWGGRCWKIP